MKKRIAFVTVRYGLDINGGAEFHCRMLAERLAGDCQVEVLTTCVKDYTKGGNEYPPGTGIMNGVTVRRFRTEPFDRSASDYWARKAKPARRLRMFLYNTGLLHPLSYIIRTWRWKLDEDIEYQKHSIFYSEEMVKYIASSKDSYDAFIAITSDFAPFYFTAMEAGEKTIAIPTMHYAKVSFRASLSQAFSRIRYVGFNTTAEQKLARRIFGPGVRHSSIISVGIEVPQPALAGQAPRNRGLYQLVQEQKAVADLPHRAVLGMVDNVHHLFLQGQTGLVVLRRIHRLGGDGNLHRGVHGGVGRGYGQHGADGGGVRDPALLCPGAG